ncbi:MAG: glycoside hydrolase family 105 protein [Lewinella sp.]
MATHLSLNFIKNIKLKINFHSFLLALILVSSCTTSNSIASKVKSGQDYKQVVEEDFKLDEDLPWSQRMTESIIKRNPESWMTDFRKTPRWSYTHGLVLLAIQKVYYETGDERYMQYVKSYADTMITAEGVIKNYKITDYNIDNINPGKILFALHKETKDDRYEKVIKTLKNQLKWQPRTKEGGYWHKLRYPYQMWLDGLYMGEPFYAQYAVEYNTPEAFDDIASQFILCEKRTKSAKSGLLYHGWDESRMQSWSNPESGKSAEVWGRAVGWYAMALVDVLDFFPKEHEGRAEIIAILQRLASTVSAVQDEETGTWYQVMDKPDAIGNYKEATVTCMLSYALAKGVRMGYLDNEYLEVAEKAYQGILDTFVEVEESGEMHIHKCCAVAGLGGDPYRDGSYEYYVNERIISNDTKATGPFIMASLEFERLAD